jgi:hypothetical protein
MATTRAGVIRGWDKKIKKNRWVNAITIGSHHRWKRAIAAFRENWYFGEARA